MVAGQGCLVWNPALSIPAREFAFSNQEVARIKAAIQTWDSYGVNAVRRWLEPLVEAFFSTATHHGGGGKPCNCSANRATRT